MALTKPMVYNVDAFDASENHTFSFLSVGGDQVIKNEIKIVDEDNTEVYNNVETTFLSSQEVPSMTLTNGEKYTVTFRTYDINDNTSDWSDGVLFYCYTTPELSVNVTQGQEIISNNYTFIATYDQEEGEKLDTLYFEIFDFDDKLIKKSDNLHSSSDVPLNISWNYSGFENNKTYKVKVTAITINKTQIETDIISFDVYYAEPIIRGRLKLFNNCRDGRVEIMTRAMYADGISNPSPMEYIEEEDKYSAFAILSDPIINYNSVTSGWINWKDDITITKNFVMKYWFNVGATDNNILELSNDNGKYLKIKFVRDTNKDYVEVTTSEGTIINSNMINHINEGTELFLWLKSNNGSYEVILTVLNTKTTIFNWNEENNTVIYNMSTDMILENEYYESNNPSPQRYYETVEDFDNLLIGNSICRELLFTQDITQSYNTDIDDWDDDNLLFKCDFDQNIRGGNIRDISQISKIKIKRKDENTNDWITIVEKDVSNIEELNETIYDYSVPSGVKQTYALVPIIQNEIEGNYLTNDIMPKWDGVFISDGIQSFKLYSGVVYGSLVQNKPIGIMNPIGSIYPIIIQNSNNNYKTGSVTGQLMGYNYEKTRVVDRLDVVRQTEDFLKFLTNGNAKFITDWNGNNFLVRLTQSPQIEYESRATNGIVRVQIVWVEQGKYNNQQDLIDNNMILKL